MKLSFQVLVGLVAVMWAVEVVNTFISLAPSHAEGSGVGVCRVSDRDGASPT